MSKKDNKLISDGIVTVLKEAMKRKII